MTPEELRIFKENHESTWRTFFKVYSIRKRLLKSSMFWISVTINMIIAAMIPFADNTFNVLNQFVDIILSVFPSLLGFSLGAYALLTGVFTTNILKRIIRNKVTKINLFQTTTATFGACLLVLSLTLILGFFIKQILVIGLFYKIRVSGYFAIGINTLLAFILNLFASYSILLLINNVKNMFGLNQFVSSMTAIDIIQETEKEGD
jgi:hypothetical protein